MKKETKITDWLESNGDIEVDRFIEKNLEIVEKVRKTLEMKGWSKTKFSEEIGKDLSKVEKWLSGMYNLTLEDIIKMEIVLGVDLVK
jgi:ribosome-binding protein aMBF1 (putative translation factor)